MLAQYKTVIFDLGGVIVDLKVEATLQAFADLSDLTLREVQQLFHQESLFNEYETGMVGETEFRNHLRQHLKVSVSDAQLDAAWNAMLLGIPAEKLDLLLQWKNNRQLLLLSNTNAIHLEYLQQKFLPAEKPALENYFHKTYYSHLVKMRKPSTEIFQYVIQDRNLNPGETVFIDDNRDNVAGAQATGLATYHLEHPDQFYQLFS